MRVDRVGKAIGRMPVRRYGRVEPVGRQPGDRLPGRWWIVRLLTEPCARDRPSVCRAGDLEEGSSQSQPARDRGASRIGGDHPRDCCSGSLAQWSLKGVIGASASNLFGRWLTR